MSPALRDAIASVRRVAHHESDEPPPRTAQVRYGLRSFDDDPAAEPGPFDRAETEAGPFFDHHGLREEPPSDHSAAAERFQRHALYEEPPPGRDRAGQQQPFDQPAAMDPSPVPTDRVAGRGSLDGDALREELRGDDGADAPLPFGARGRRGRSSFAMPAARSLPLEDDVADPQQFSDGRSDEDSPQGVQEASRDRAPLRRDGTQRRGLHVAALALAPIFVLVVGFGFGILSGAQEFDRLLTTIGWQSLPDGPVEARPSDPAPPRKDLAPPSTSSAHSSTSAAAPPSTSSAQELAGAAEAPAKPAPSPPLTELETVRVAPLPAPPKTESTPDPTTSDMPLPPPPKPAPWSSFSEERAGSERVEGAVDAAAGAVLATEGTADDGVEDAAGAVLATEGTADDGVEDAAVAVPEADGAGGPFEPILVKTSISEPRVFVHYTESAPGSPATALNVVRQLRAAGFTVEGRAVEFSIPRASIRYFFDGDRDEAEAVSARLQGQVPGGAVPIMDFTTYEPKPREGHIEVWLGG